MRTGRARQEKRAKLGMNGKGKSTKDVATNGAVNKSEMKKGPRLNKGGVQLPANWQVIFLEWRNPEMLNSGERKGFGYASIFYPVSPSSFYISQLYSI